MTMKTANAIRMVTAKMQAAYDAGNRSASIDMHDLIEVLLAIADEVEPCVLADGNHPADASRPDGVSVAGWRDAHDEIEAMAVS
jgi:hypothetical protein